MESYYFTRTFMQVFFADFDTNFKSANKTLPVNLLKQSILRLLLGTNVSYFSRSGLMKCCMAKCYDFYGIFMAKTFTKYHERCFVSLNGKPVQIVKCCFSVIVHSGMLRENKIKSKMRKAFCYKIFCSPKKLIHHCFWFKLSEFLLNLE